MPAMRMTADPNTTVGASKEVSCTLEAAKATLPSGALSDTEPKGVQCYRLTAIQCRTNGPVNARGPDTCLNGGVLGVPQRGHKRL